MSRCPTQASSPGAASSSRVGEREPRPPRTKASSNACARKRPKSTSGSTPWATRCAGRSSALRRRHAKVRASLRIRPSTLPADDRDQETSRMRCQKTSLPPTAIPCLGPSGRRSASRHPPCSRGRWPRAELCHVAARRARRIDASGSVKPLWQGADECPVYVSGGNFSQNLRSKWRIFLTPTFSRAGRLHSRPLTKSRLSTCLPRACVYPGRRFWAASTRVDDFDA